MKALWLAAVAALLTGTLASAGELRIKIAPDTTSMLMANVALTAFGQSRKPAADGLVTLDWSDAQSLTTRVMLASDEPSAGMADFALSFNMPYYWLDDLPEDLVVAVVPTDFNRDDITPLRNEFKRTSNSLEGLTLTNQLARQAFLSVMRALENPARVAKRDDAQVVFIFAQTSKELVVNHFVTPDEDMRVAVTWLEENLEDPAQAALLFPNTTEKDNTTELVLEFNEYAVVQRGSLVLKLDADMQEAYPQTPAEICVKVTALDKLFIRESAADPLVEENLYYAIKNVTNVGRCRYGEVLRASTDDDSVVASATAVTERIAEWLASYVPASPRGQSAFAKAKRVGDDLATLIAARG